MVEELSNQIGKIIEKVQECSSDYAQMKELFFDDYNMDLAEDSVKVLKLLNNSRKAFSMMKFKFFIKGVNYNNYSSKDLQKLVNYIDNDIKAEFITSTFNKIINANSKIACCIMGLLINDMTNRDKNVSQCDLAMIQVLSLMNDFDVYNFVYLMNMCTWPKNRKYKKLSESDINGCINGHVVSREDLDMTISVLEKGGLIERDAEVDLNVDKDDLSFSSADYQESIYFNMLSKNLYEYAKVIIELLENEKVKVNENQ